MAKKASLGKNYIFNLIYQVLGIFFPVITAPYVARVLGADGVGIYNYGHSVVYIYSLVAALGISTYTIREIAYHQDDKYKNSKIFYEAMILKLILTALCTVIYFLTFVRGAEGVHKQVYAIQSITILGTFLNISWVYQGKENFKDILIRNLVVKLLSVTSIFIFVKSPKDLPIYCVVYAISEFIGNLTLWVKLPKELVKVRLKELDVVKIIKPSLVFFIPSIAIYVYTSLDKVVLGMLSDTAQVGFYTETEKIVKIALTIITSLGTVLLPRMSSVIKNQSLDDGNKLLFKAYKIVFMLGLPMTIGMISVADNFIPLFLGNEFAEAAVLMKVLAPLAVIMGIASITGNAVLIPLGRQNKYNIVSVIGACVNLCLNLLLIGQFKAVGAAVATIIAEGIVTLTQLYFVRDRYTLWDIVKCCRNYIISTAIMLMALLALSLFENQGWGFVFLQVCMGAGLYILTLLLLKDEMLINTIEKFLKKKNSAR